MANLNKKNKTKSYKEGYDFAIKCCNDEYINEIEDMPKHEADLHEDIFVHWEKYNPYKKSQKQYRLFELGKKDAIDFMERQNELIGKFEEHQCFDNFCEESHNIDSFYEIISEKDKKKARELMKKYNDGICALIDFYKELSSIEYFDL